jgi:hypothetical protein
VHEVASRFLADHCLDMRMLSVLVRQMEEAMLTSSGTSIAPEMTTFTKAKTVRVWDSTSSSSLDGLWILSCADHGYF